MRDAFAHDAVLVMEPHGDSRAPGAAITLELCGSWEHEGPCPVAPHHTSATRAGEELHLRILFAVEPSGEADVRRRIDAALAAGQLRESVWELRSSGAGALLPDEMEHALRIAES